MKCDTSEHQTKFFLCIMYFFNTIEGRGALQIHIRIMNCETVATNEGCREIKHCRGCISYEIACQVRR